MNADQKSHQSPSYHSYGERYPIEWWLGSEASATHPSRPDATPNARSCLARRDVASRPEGTSPEPQAPVQAGRGNQLNPITPMPQGSTSSPSSPPASSSKPLKSDTWVSNATVSSFSDEEFKRVVNPEPRSWRERLRDGIRTPRRSNTNGGDITGRTVQETLQSESASSPPRTTVTGDESDRDSNESQDCSTLPSLTEAERSMYASEWQDNFRWLSKLAGSYAKDCKLTEVEDETKKRVDEIGMYSELVYSYVPVGSLFKDHQLLEKEGILPEYQPVLSDCTFIDKIDGPKTDLSAFVVYRKSTRQLIVSISGSSSPKHLLENLRVVRTPWLSTSDASVEKNVSTPSEPSEAPMTDDTPASTELSEPPTPNKTPVPSVHSGFLRLYHDIKVPLHSAIRKGFEHEPKELIITGHSMGGSVSHLLCMDLLSGSLGDVPLPKHVCLATYGAPRTGNAALVKHFRGLVEEFRSKGLVFEEHSVKAYNDGVPAVPPRIFGYAHFAQQPMYAFHRKLYAVPPGNEEASLFTVDIPQDSSDGAQSQSTSQLNRFPRGGHNYYNGRDLEGFRRVTNRLVSAGFPGNGWEERLKRKSASKSQERLAEETSTNGVDGNSPALPK